MSKAAISRAIAKGTLSAERLDSGAFQIDPAELHRVYPPVTSEPVRAIGGATKHNGALNTEARELQIRLEAAEQRLRDLAGVLDDLRDDRDHWRTQAERLVLTDQRTQPVTQHRSVLARIRALLGQRSGAG